MKLNNTNAIDSLAQNMLDFFSIQDYKDIIQFAVEDVSLADDISAQYDRINLDKFPYMVEVLKNCTIEAGKHKEIVVVWPEQFGKSTLEYLAILYNCCYNTLQCLLLYPSLDLAMEMNQVKFIPLFKNLPQFRQEIQKPYAIRSDRLKLSNAVIYFDGAGKKIVGKSCKLVLGDECAIYPQMNNINNILELKKRCRSYSQALQIFVSSPNYKENQFWQEFLASSQGYYTLRCNGCGQLTMRSCDLQNLQFQSFYNEDLRLYQVKPGTCRLICPKCHYEHEEAEREQIIMQGAYVHKYPDKAQVYAGYQAGCLASLNNIYSWDSIADVILASGKSGTLEDYLNLDNSYKALPLQDRDYSKQQETAISQHFFKPQSLKKEDIEAIVVSADTQGTFSVYSVMALTRNNNFYVIEAGRVRFLFLDDEERKIINMENQRNGKPPELTLLDILNREYLGIKPLCLLVDEGGNRSDQIKNFSRIQRNILMYKGTSLKFDNWHVSENHPKLFLCDFKKSLAQFIFMLHFQKNKEANYLFLPQTLTEQDIAEILSFKPDNTKRNGGAFQNYTCQDRVHDMADTIRMGLMAFKIASKIYKKQRFIHGQAKMLNWDKNPLKKPEKKKVITRPVNQVSRNIFNRRY